VRARARERESERACSGARTSSVLREDVSWLI
jgi:hypothetical protein